MKNKIQNIKIAAAQASPVYLNKEATVEKVCHLIEEAAKEGANLIVFPEAFIPGYPDWVWLIPNSRSKELNDLYLELIKNGVSAFEVITSVIDQEDSEARFDIVSEFNPIEISLNNETVAQVMSRDQNDIIELLSIGIPYSCTFSSHQGNGKITLKLIDF
ncbi:MAG: hypothetical protein KAR14_03405 [Candidatus Aminicenantes bacterium]|nr:hypothetical protein [Candidatus Aminicenantes bacterium]